MNCRSLSPLISGERLDRAEFHRRYETMPERPWFELIGGVVHQKGRVNFRHSLVNASVLGCLGHYALHTPGVEGLAHASTALDDLAEVHPDAAIRIAPERGGRSFNLGEIVGGAPEFVVEISDESPSIDLGVKLIDYERAGVLEYVVFALDTGRIHWHVRRLDRFVRVGPDPDGLYRSKVFPGLWLDPGAMLSDDNLTVYETLKRGLATADHAELVSRLAAS